MTENNRIQGQAAQRRSLIVSGMALALLGGCATNTITPPDQWPVVELEDATVMPSPAQLQDINRRTKVVVMQPTESPAARGAGLPEVASAALEALFGAGGVEVVDRRVADKLDKELKLIEIQGKQGSGSYDGPQVADYAITVVMGTATWGSTFNAAVTLPPDKKTGKVTTIPASYTYSGKSTMTLRVYQLPSLRLVASLPAEGTTSVSGQNVPAPQAQAASLMRAATEDGIIGKKAEVLNIFAPRGYISERRAKDKKNIFRALISKATGAKTGDEVEIVSLRSSVDPLTKRQLVDQTQVATGRISNVINEDSSWVIVDDEKAAASVRRGDIIKVKHSTSIWDTIKVPSVLKSVF